MTSPDIDSALQFLEFVQPQQTFGHWSLAAVAPDSPGIDCLTTSDTDAIRTFIYRNNASGRNIYYQPNFCRNLADARASKKDVAVAVAVHADVDPPPGDAIALKVWQETTLEQYSQQAFWETVELPAPSAIVFSGSGYQLLWLLEEPLPLWNGSEQDTEALDAIEGRNYATIMRMDPSHAGTNDVSRLLRLPGTLNYPNQKKKENGRTEPVLAWSFTSEERYPLTAFPYLTPPVTRKVPASNAQAGAQIEPEELRKLVPDYVFQRIVDSPAPGADRNGVQHSVVAQMTDCGLTDDMIIAVVTDQTYGISAHALSQSDPVRAVRRSIDKSRDIQADNEGIEELLNPKEPPTSTTLDTFLRAKANKLKKTDPGELLAKTVLTKILKREMLAVEPSEQSKELDLAIKILLITVTKSEEIKHTTDLQIATLLFGSLKGVDTDILLEKIADARANLVGQTKAEGEFAIERMGPRAGMPCATQDNVDVAMRRLGVSVHYNEFADREVFERNGERSDTEDHHVTGLWLEIETKYRFKPDKNYFYDVISNRARMNTFHPVRDYVDSLQWDGKNRIGNIGPSWLTTYGGAIDDEYTRAVGRLVLVAAVRRVRQPGCKFDEMLILESPQGRQKSSCLKILAVNDAWFSDDLPLDADTKRLMEATAGKWIIEAGELKGMKKSDIAGLKQYLSRPVDQARMAYGRKDKFAPRQFIVIGTTNDDEYLEDPTGNRRFWPVRITEFDLVALKRDVHQLWAEAAYLDLEHPEETYIRLDPSLYKLAEAAQEHRRPENVWASEIATWATRKTKTGPGVRPGRTMHTIAEVAKEALGIEIGDLKQPEQRAVTGALKAAGFVCKNTSRDGLRGRYWVHSGIETVEEPEKVVSVN